MAHQLQPCLNRPPALWIASSRSSLRVSSLSRLRNFASATSLNCAVTTIASMFAISKNAALLPSEAPIRSSLAVLAPAPNECRGLNANDTTTMAHQGSGVDYRPRVSAGNRHPANWQGARRGWAAPAHRFSTTCCQVLSRRHPATVRGWGNGTRYPSRRGANTYVRRDPRCRGWLAPCLCA